MSTPRERTLLGLPFRDALLVLIVAVAIALTIAAFAARVLGASDLGTTSLDRPSNDELSIPVSTLGGTSDDYPREH